MALQYVFERIALSRGNADTYLQFRERGEHHITDMLEPANESGVYMRAGATITAAPGNTAAGANTQRAIGQSNAAPVTTSATTAAQDDTAETARNAAAAAATAAADSMAELQAVAAAEHAVAAASVAAASAGKPQAARKLFEWTVRS
jgi:hypothetical protein